MGSTKPWLWFCRRKNSIEKEIEGEWHMNTRGTLGAYITNSVGGE